MDENEEYETNNNTKHCTKKKSVKIPLKLEYDDLDSDEDIEMDDVEKSKRNYSFSKKLFKPIKNINKEKNDKTCEKDVKKKKKGSKPIRHTMYLNDDEAKPVTAAGALIYKKFRNKLKLLIIESDRGFEDIGGKIDTDDQDIFSAAAREIEEETNKKIKIENTLERLKKAPYVYVPKSKYVIFLLEASDKEKRLTKDEFGEYEIHDQIQRTIGWIDLKEFSKSSVVKFKLNWRLRNKSLFDKLSDIEKRFVTNKKIFKSSDE
jgi:hypothetical protein